MTYNQFYLKLHTSEDFLRKKWEEYFSDTYLELNYNPRDEDLIDLKSFMDLEDEKDKAFFEEFKNKFNTDYLVVMKKIHSNNDKCILLVCAFKPRNGYDWL